MYLQLKKKGESNQHNFTWNCQVPYSSLWLKYESLCFLSSDMLFLQNHDSKCPSAFIMLLCRLAVLIIDICVRRVEQIINIFWVEQFPFEMCSRKDHFLIVKRIHKLVFHIRSTIIIVFLSKESREMTQLYFNYKTFNLLSVREVQIEVFMMYNLCVQMKFLE